MRQDCKYFESRTYPNGDTVRKCDLDLAPEAPWRCPEDCPKYTRRMADVNWRHGSLITPKTPPEPASLGMDPSIGDLLDEAESIVNSAAPSVLAEFAAEKRKRGISRLRPGRLGVRRSLLGGKKQDGGTRGKNPKPPRGGNARKKSGGGNERRRPPRGGRPRAGGSSGGLGERFRRRFREGG